MKKLTTFLIAGALFAATATVSFAQSAGPKNGAPGAGQRQGGPGGPGGPRMGGGMRRGAEILKQLNLTPKQKSAIEALNAKFMKEMESMRPKGDAPKAGQKGQPGERPRMSDADRSKFMEKMKAHREAIMKILTPEQRAKYEKLMKEMREKNRQGGPGGRPGAGGAGKPGKPGGGGGN